MEDCVHDHHNLTALGCSSFLHDGDRGLSPTTRWSKELLCFPVWALPFSDNSSHTRREVLPLMSGVRLKCRLSRRGKAINRNELSPELLGSSLIIRRKRWAQNWNIEGDIEGEGRREIINGYVPRSPSWALFSGEGPAPMLTHTPPSQHLHTIVQCFVHWLNSQKMSCWDFSRRNKESRHWVCVAHHCDPGIYLRSAPQ